MPIREFVTTILTNNEVGEQWWNAGSGRCQSMPTSQYYEAKIRADQRYCRFVELIDWKRALLMAQSRHYQVCVPQGKSTEVCGECLQQALLYLETMPDWKEKAPTERSDLQEKVKYWKENEARYGWRENQDRPKE